MAEERRKGAPDRRRSRETKRAETGAATNSGEPRNPNDTPALDAAERLDESIRSRQQEERGEVF